MTNKKDQHQGSDESLALSGHGDMSSIPQSPVVADELEEQVATILMEIDYFKQVVLITKLITDKQLEARIDENRIYLIAATDSGDPNATVKLSTLIKTANDRIDSLRKEQL